MSRIARDPGLPRALPLGAVPALLLLAGRPAPAGDPAAGPAVSRRELRVPGGLLSAGLLLPGGGWLVARAEGRRRRRAGGVRRPGSARTRRPSLPRRAGDPAGRSGSRRSRLAILALARPQLGRAADRARAHRPRRAGAARPLALDERDRRAGGHAARRGEAARRGKRWLGVAGRPGRSRRVRRQRLPAAPAHLGPRVAPAVPRRGEQRRPRRSGHRSLRRAPRRRCARSSTRARRAGARCSSSRTARAARATSSARSTRPGSAELAVFADRCRHGTRAARCPPTAPTRPIRIIAITSAGSSSRGWRRRICDGRGRGHRRRGMPAGTAPRSCRRLRCGHRAAAEPRTLATRQRRAAGGPLPVAAGARGRAAVAGGADGSRSGRAGEGASSSRAERDGPERLEGGGEPPRSARGDNGLVLARRSSSALPAAPERRRAALPRGEYPEAYAAFRTALARDSSARARVQRRRRALPAGALRGGGRQRSAAPPTRAEIGHATAARALQPRERHGAGRGGASRPRRSRCCRRSPPTRTCFAGSGGRRTPSGTSRSLSGGWATTGSPAAPRVGAETQTTGRAT